MTHLPAPGRGHLALLAAAIGLPLFSACSVVGSPKDVVPVHKIAGNDPGKVLVVVLPGFAFDHDDLRDKGVATAIQKGWPSADVALVGATFPYYRTGVLVEKLHAQVIAPARAAGYRQVWLAGGSMGGMGTLLYEQAHPGELTGLVILSPFLGSDDLLDEIREAGLERWSAGELSPVVDGDNYQRHVWKMIQGWGARPDPAARVWLACGTEDPLFKDVQVMAPVVPKDQYLPSPGGHSWDYWLPVVEDTFKRIAAKSPR
ncbi:MAG TPA: hypothetical protein VM240_00920 [Verrucomicrobiae bacterium]|nr:hypothetical protein [Verrucomicrobiae bacterium]